MILSQYRSSVSSYWPKVGQCARCMRQAGMICCGAWLATGIVAWFAPVAITTTVGVFALAATVLSILHIVTFTVRKVSATQRRHDAGIRLSRRLAFRTLLQAAGSAVLIMATSGCMRAEAPVAQGPVSRDHPLQSGGAVPLASRCGGWDGECSDCERNFRLDEHTSGCRECENCTRPGRRCTNRGC
jgi:hypothetical protein